MTYWWDLLGELGRIHKLACDIDWATCNRAHYIEPVPEESGVFRRDSGRRGLVMWWQFMPWVIRQALYAPRLAAKCHTIRCVAWALRVDGGGR
jgi:hypothetical protein